MTRLLSFLSLCCLVLNLLGCGKSDPDAVRETTTAFLAASNTGDRAAFIGHMTQAAQAKMDSPEGKAFNINAKSATPYTVGKPVIAESAAEVPVSSKDVKGNPIEGMVKLNREDGVWRVWSMTISLPQTGMPINLDFEHPETFSGEMIKAMGAKP